MTHTSALNSHLTCETSKLILVNLTSRKQGQVVDGWWRQFSHWVLKSLVGVISSGDENA